jgi:hypothetical protein
MRTTPWQEYYRYGLRILGLVLALPILALILMAFALPITISGIGYLAGSVFVIAGFILAPWVRRSSIVLTIIGVLVIALVASMRLILARQETTANLRMVTLPQGQEIRWINYLIDEQDNLIFGETLFHFIGGDSDNEHEAPLTSMRSSSNRK